MLAADVHRKAQEMHEAEDIAGCAWSGSAIWHHDTSQSGCSASKRIDDGILGTA